MHVVLPRVYWTTLSLLLFWPTTIPTNNFRWILNNFVVKLLHTCKLSRHDDVIKWKHFRRYWPFVRRIHRSPVNSPHKGQWRGALMYFWICVWINGWVNTREAGDLRRYRAHYDVTVMGPPSLTQINWLWHGYVITTWLFAQCNW